MTKLLLSLLCFSLSAAAADVVVVVSAKRVTVNGEDYGKPADAIANHPQLASDIQTALEAWAADQAAAVTAATAAQQRAEAKLKLLVDGAKDALTKPTSAERLAAGNALLTQVQASQTDGEKAALLKQQAEITAKLQALESSAP